MNDDNKPQKLPDFFKPILWSYNFDKIDPARDKKLIIINSINYGSLSHWRWIAGYYGKALIKNILENISIYEIRNHVRKLAAIIFNIEDFNNAPRGSGRRAA